MTEGEGVRVTRKHGPGLSLYKRMAVDQVDDAEEEVEEPEVVATQIPFPIAVERTVPETSVRPGAVRRGWAVVLHNAYADGARAATSGRPRLHGVRVSTSPFILAWWRGYDERLEAIQREEA